MAKKTATAASPKVEKGYKSLSMPARYVINLVLAAVFIFVGEAMIDGGAISRYQTGVVNLPVKEFDSVLDMAESYHFGISEGAQKAIDEYRSKIQTVAPEAPAAAPEDKDTKEILNSSREVIEDLKDD